MTKYHERSRAWTRAEDYWPPARIRRRRRMGQGRLIQPPSSDGGDPIDNPRISLGLLPYFALMLSLAILAVAIMVAAWPGRRHVTAPPVPQANEVGTAPKGWMKAQ